MRPWILAGLATIVFGFTLLAGDEGIAGNWKLMIIEDNQLSNFWLVNLKNDGGKWAGTAEGLKEVPKTTVNKIQATGDTFSFELKLQTGPTFTFEGKIPQAGAKKVLGSLSRGGVNAIPAWLEATGATNRFELDKEFVTRSPNDPRVFGIIMDLINQAKENKASEKEIQEWVAAATKASENFGPRYQSQLSLRLLDLLQSQGEYPTVALDLANQVEKSIDEKTPADMQVRVLSLIGRTLRSAKKTAEADAIDKRVDTLEETAYKEHIKKNEGFELTKYAGRKKDTNRAVLVELFTGAQCPPCVAADLGFDALEKTFPSSDVVLLQYHMHVPGPDPLTNPDTEGRFDYYAEAFSRQIRGTPAILFNGKPDALGGGGADGGPVKYAEYSKIINQWLEKATETKLGVDAVRTGNKIKVDVQLKDLEKPAKTMKLRVALTEDWVRYRGSNGLAYHSRVVRTMPSTPKGVPLEKKAEDFTFNVDLDELRTSLGKYLDGVAKEAPFPDSNRPMRMRDLRVVAFVQNDDTAEILQAVEAKVQEK